MKAIGYALLFGCAIALSHNAIASEQSKSGNNKAGNSSGQVQTQGLESASRTTTKSGATAPVMTTHGGRR